MRIFQGMIDGANQAGSAASGLRRRGHQVTLAVFEPNRFSAIQPDLILYPQAKPLRPVRWVKSLAFAHRQMLAHDIFHFHYKASMLPYNLDIPALRLRGKKVFMEFHGSDIRQGAAWSKGNPQSGLYEGYAANPNVQEQVERLCRMVDGVIVHDSELAMYLPEWAPVSFIPLRVDVPKYTPCYPDPNKVRPLVVHLPSHSGIKGTRYVQEVVEQLARNYEFDYMAPERIPHAEAAALLAKADIVVDQLILGVYGVLSIEAMAFGKPIIDFLRDDIRVDYPADLPVVNASRDNLYDVLANLLENPQLRTQIGKAGRAYAQQNHDCVKVAGLLERLYSGDRAGIGDASSAFQTVATIKTLASEGGQS